MLDRIDELVPKPDARVAHTQRAMAGALYGLVHEKPYQRITVQDLIDRSAVERSTFHAHFRGKDELVLQGFERLVGALYDQADQSGQPRRLAPVRELFEHVAGTRRFHDALVSAGVIQGQHHARVALLARHIERRLARRLDPRPRPGQTSGGVTVPVAVHARYLAGALLSLLSWWLDHRGPYTAERMDELFHSLA